MSIDVDGEMLKFEQRMQTAQDALIELGFPADQWDLVNEFIQAAIAHSHYAISKAGRNIKKESAEPAFERGGFQTGVLV